MIAETLKKTLLAGLLLAAAIVPASAHVGIGSTASLAAGFVHPLFGVDHMTVMIAVGLWAALKGGKALWVWPAVFVGVMLAGAAFAMAGVSLPFVEPAILASVVVLGLLVTLAINLPVSAGAAIVGLFALFHGHAHGSEVAANVGGLEYMAGFALATAGLHATGIAAATALGARYRQPVRFAGAACATVGMGLVLGAI